MKHFMIILIMPLFLVFAAEKKEEKPQDQATCIKEAKSKYDKGKKDCKGISSWKQATCLKGVIADYKKAQKACGSLKKAKSEAKEELKKKGLNKIPGMGGGWM